MTAPHTPQTAPTTSDPLDPAFREFVLSNSATIELILQSNRSNTPSEASISSPETSTSSSTETAATATTTIMEGAAAAEEVAATGKTVATEEAAATEETPAAAETATTEETTATKEAAAAAEKIDIIKEIPVAAAAEETTITTTSQPSQPPPTNSPTTTPAPPATVTAELLSDPGIISPLKSAKSKGECECGRKKMAEEGEEGSEDKPGELSVNPKMEWGLGPAPGEKNSSAAPQARPKKSFLRRVFRRHEGGGESGVVGNVE